MRLVPKLPEAAQSTLHRFLRAHALEGGAKGVVLGLSGGIDSALAARLAADAIGPSAVLGVLLPDAEYSPALLEETRDYAGSLGIGVREVSIATIESAVRGLFPEVSDPATWGNVKARARMLVAYTLARELGRRVLGTGNKSELLLGYFTKYGDGGVDLLPLGDLYKTQIRELAARLELPRPIRDRPPTAGLWPGQTDEAELGLPYEQLDQVLFGIEQLVPLEDIASATGLEMALVASIDRRVQENRHKRRLPPIPKVGLRTIGLDWRE